MADSNEKATPLPSPPSLLERVGWFGVLKIAGTVGVFLMFCLFYTILPLAGLQLLPFLFFGTVCLIVGVADDMGAY